MARTLIFGIMLMVLMASAMAALEITETQAGLDVDYGDFTNEDQETVTSTTSLFTIKNTDGAVNRTVSIDAVFTQSGYSLVQSKTETIPANSSKQVSLQVKVPHKLGSGNATIGTIRIREGSTEKTIPLVQHTESMLHLKDIEIEYTDKDSKAESTSLDEDDEDLTVEKDILVGTEVTIKFTIENLFDNDYDSNDGALDNIEMRFEIDDDDIYEESVEEDVELADLDAKEKADGQFSFVISNDADAKEYTFDIVLKGEDGKGAEHEVTRTLTFDVARKRNDVRITEAKLTPATLTACDESFAFDVEITNFGTRDHKKAAVAIYNTELGINENIAGIELQEYSDDDNSWRKHFTFSHDLDKKTYKLDLKAYIDNDEEMDSEIIDVVVGACKGTAVEPEEPVEPADEPETVEQPEETTTAPETATAPSPSGTTQPVSRSTVVQTVEESYTVDEMVLGGMIVVGVLLVALIALFVAILVKK